MMLEDTAEALRNSDEIMRMDNLKTLTEILEDTDGCSVQYRCGTALYLLHKLAHGNSIIYDRGINAPGRGKIIIDGINGTDKGDLEKEFCGNVEYQPEALVEGKRSILMFQMEDGQRRSC